MFICDVKIENNDDWDVLVRILWINKDMCRQDREVCIVCWIAGVLKSVELIKIMIVV